MSWFHGALGGKNPSPPRPLPPPELELPPEPVPLPPEDAVAPDDDPVPPPPLPGEPEVEDADEVVPLLLPLHATALASMQPVTMTTEGRGRFMRGPQHAARAGSKRGVGVGRMVCGAKGCGTRALPHRDCPREAVEIFAVTDTNQLPEDDFGALFEASLKKKRKRLQPGEKAKGTVISVGEKRVLLDMGDGLDGMMEFSELAPPGEKPTVKVGEVLEGYVLRADDRTVELGRSLGRSGGSKAALEQAQQSGLPVEGTVAEVNKGGYVVDVGGTRCFCPLGQMDLRRIEDPAVMVGKKFLFRVTELKGGRDAVLSRKALLEVEQAEKAQKIRALVVPGARLRGTVVSVRDFGAFVDLGGLEGMVPASELTHGRSRPQDVVRPGQDVDVEVMRIEPGKDGKGERISLSMRALVEHPFEATRAELSPGTVVAGRVTRVQPFGAFVELVPGVEGLIHVSAFGKRINHPSDVVKAEQVVAVRVQDVDAESRRVSLAWVTPEDAAAAGYDVPKALDGTLRKLGHMDVVEAAPAATGQTGQTGEPKAPRAPAPPRAVTREGDVVNVTVDKVETFGVFVKWDTGRGLVPNSELGAAGRMDARKSFPVGTAFRALVLEVRADGKMRLSRTAVDRAEEQAEAAAYMKSAPATGGGTRGLGTLGDLLKAKLGK